MSEHTPWRWTHPIMGPGAWYECRYDNDGGYDIIDAGNGKVGEAATLEHARLIAAAPTLFELLEGIENDAGHIPAGYWQRIQDVVAQVRGEAAGAVRGIAKEAQRDE